MHQLDITSEFIRQKIANAFGIPLDFLTGVPGAYSDYVLNYAGQFEGEDGTIFYDMTRYSLLKRKHVISWIAKAYTNAELSHAVDLKVGALVVDTTGLIPNILSDGYNGTAPGTDNSCEGPDGESLGHDVVIHAERNAIEKLSRRKTSIMNCAVVTTRSPCSTCCELIKEAGIKEVYFTEQHRLVKPLLDLQAAGIKVVRIPKEEVIKHMTSTLERLQKDRFC